MLTIPVQKHLARLVRQLLISFGFILLLVSRASANEERYLSEILGADIYTSKTYEVRDEKFGSPDNDLVQENISINDIATFEINFGTSTYFYGTPFTATLNFKIYIYDDHNNPNLITDSTTHSNINLSVQFDNVTGNSYKAIAMYKFKGARKFGIRVLSITSAELGATIPPIFRLKSEVIIDRKYKFEDLSTGITKFSIVNGNQLSLDWGALEYPGAEMFDVEYTHVDFSSGDGAMLAGHESGGSFSGISEAALSKIFKNNSTRVTTSASNYLLNASYDKGYILFRIRGVQIHHPDNVRWEGQWNYNASNDPECTSGCGQSVVFFDAHELNLNWQYSASFAEEGKRKEVISYFDGTLRNRQTVTISNTENKNIVQETIYDALGRPALNILPAPTDDNTLHFFRGFNKNTIGAPYSFSDIEYTSCITIAKDLNTVSGAANYYSPLNSFLDDYRNAAFIPNAFKKPFAVTEYMADNTGRIKAQGGVGPEFQLDGKATKYYYGKPLQTELDRLFGNEAGNASHYLKNMVMDPNGQVSVSYVDAAGRTIATALAGELNSRLHPLKSQSGASTTITDELIQPTDLEKDALNKTVTASATFLAPVPGTYTFNYKLDPLKMDKWFGVLKDSVICSHCYYDLVISVKNNCDETIGSFTQAAGNVFDTACASSVMALDNSFNVSIGEIGEYYLTYNLKISSDAMDFYDEVHLAKNTEIKKLNFFLLEEIKRSDFYSCFNQCETCLDALGGSAAAFNLRFKNLYLADSLPFNPEDSLYALQLYDSLYANCSRLQSECGLNKSICDEKLEQLKLDVTPGGQYALYNDQKELLEPAINVLSHRSQIVFFSNEFGVRDSVLLKNIAGEDSVYLDVKDLSDSLFIEHWNDSWADSLVRLHPEYCNYLWCISNETSYAFDRHIENWMDADSAKLYGWFSPTSYDTILAKDPFFNLGGAGALLKEKMRKDLRLFSRTYIGTAQPDKNILGFIDVVLYCKNQEDGWGNCHVEENCRSRNREWFMYKVLYQNLKRKYIEEAKRSSSNPVFANCTNCFIGKDLIGLVNTCIPPDTADFNITVSDSVRISHPSGSLGRNVLVNLKYFGSCGSQTRSYPFGALTIDTSFALPTLGCSIDSFQVALSCDTAKSPYLNFIPPGCSYNCNAGAYNPFDKDSVSVYVAYGLPDELPAGIPSGYDNWQYYPVYNLQTGTATSCQFTNVWVGLKDSTFSGWPCPSSDNFVVNPSGEICDRGSAIEVEVSYTGPAIPVGVTVKVNVQYTNGISTYNRLAWFNSSTSVQLYCSQFTSASGFSGTITSVVCTGIVDTAYHFIYPPSSCPADPNAAAYAGKIRRYQDYVNADDYLKNIQATNPAQKSETSLLEIKDRCRDNCEAQAMNWMNKLKGCTNDPAKLALLKAALIDICSKGCSAEYPFGTSSIPSSIPATYHSFEEAILEILELTSVNKTCAVELLESPFPHTVKPVLVERNIVETNYDICAKITQYKNKFTTSGSSGSFHRWLLNTAGKAYTLDSLELDDLLNSCTNCNGLLKNDIVLPAIFEPGTPPCLSCSVIATGFNDFRIKFPDVDTTEEVFIPMFSNFLNRRFGYTLTFADYSIFRDSCNKYANNYPGLLCNIPATETVSIANDGTDCLKSVFSSSLSIAFERYTVYIDSVRKDFRDAYSTRCLNVQSSVGLTAELFEYHYTLYYYDQSGNLVKTIPPEGVVLLQGEKLEEVKQYRLLGNKNCFAYSDKILMNGDDYALFPAVPAHDGKMFTAEMMVNLTASSDNGIFAGLTIEEYPGGPPGVNFMKGIVVATIDNKLYVDLFAVGDPGVQRRGHFKSKLDASTLLPLDTWKHLAIVRSADELMPVEVYIDGNPVAMELIMSDLDEAVQFNSGGSMGIGGVVYNPATTDPIFLNGSVKNFRFYNRRLGSMEIRQNAYSTCKMPVSNNGLIFWAPLTSAPGNVLELWAGTSPGNLVGGELDPNNGVFPDHGLPTKYEYNSLNQVVKQITPDADESEFWYDRLGRLTASQNKEQKENAGIGGATADRYSYTKYDALGRIKEVGEKSGAEDIRELDLLDNTVLTNWLGSGTDRQLTKTAYDVPVTYFQNPLTSRKRVTASIYLENADDAEGDSTLYNYDILGNVKTLQQHIKALVAVDATNGKKQVDYDYDLVSGKVNRVSYQLGKGDQFMYSYLYDADNRVIEARSSRDGLVWRTDASYEYYLHGPLARTELGHLKSQGIDYAYTLQGWLKGINSDSLNPVNDMMRDGHHSSVYSRVARDVYGFKLGYFNDDYTAIHPDATSFTHKMYQAPATNTLEFAGNQLFNGNISYTTLALSKIDNGRTTGYTYGYDQLNRLVEMRQHAPIGGTWNNTDTLLAYGEKIKYDANGNILEYIRRGGTATPYMDYLNYQYNYDGAKLLNNKLDHVKDAVAAGNYAVDIDDQSALNYEYDHIGNLVKDASEGINDIDWTVYGKIKKITKGTGYGTGQIQYGYDPAGNRTLKKLTSSGTDSLTFYVRDGQGNVLAIYSKLGSANLKWNEQHLYGSNRLGVWHWEKEIAAAAPNVTGTSLIDDLHIGSKNYELSNHLGNVLATISDKIIGNDSSGVSNYFLAESLTQQDYYPFGMLQPGRTFEAGSLKYRYGFNGKEMDNEIEGSRDQYDYGFRIYNARLGRFLSLDPLQKKFPFYTPYQFSGNSPIANTDLDGREDIWFMTKMVQILAKLQLEVGKAEDAMRNYSQSSNNNYGKYDGRENADIQAQIDANTLNGIKAKFQLSAQVFKAGAVGSAFAVSPFVITSAAAVVPELYVATNVMVNSISLNSLGSSLATKTVSAFINATSQKITTGEIDWVDVFSKYLPAKGEWAKRAINILEASFDYTDGQFKFAFSPDPETRKKSLDVLIDAATPEIAEKLFGKFNTSLKKAFEDAGVRGEKLVNAMGKIITAQSEYVQEMLKSAASDTIKKKVNGEQKK